ncbi:MAG: hypothetical protein M3Y72_10990 [Acidobacteriota bacterium]|nr:hypothetical protein [Acidobacteriota bacterium]
MKRIVFAVLFCGVGFATTIGGIVATHKEILRYFKMPEYMGAVPENIQAVISQNLPIGSSPSDVEHFLALRGIGRDRGSICAAKPNGLDVNCQLGIDHHSWELIRETFNLSFTFDSDGKLRDITVRSTFSSPW